ncbi:MAG: hypothetical protein GY917_26520 [Planctomycetaceae bacterium]|nr:hypothetical protein [Planctomycetaceae bacterium]
MQRATWITCCWPGLPQLWLRGQWRGLVTALAFAVLVNLGLAATFIWPQWWPASWCQVLWGGLGLTWCITAIHSCRFVAGWKISTTISTDRDWTRQNEDDYFSRAQAHYLKQNWFEAEQCLSSAVSVNAHDIDAFLMLISLFRHTGRHQEAKEVLQHVNTLETNGKWNWELKREQELLDSFESLVEEESAIPANPSVDPLQPLPRAA